MRTLPQQLCQHLRQPVCQQQDTLDCQLHRQRHQPALLHVLKLGDMLQPPAGPREFPVPAGPDDDPADVPPHLAEGAGEGGDAPICLLPHLQLW